MHRRLFYIYLLNVPRFSSRYFNKIKRTSRLGRLLALSLEILYRAIVNFFAEIFHAGRAAIDMKHIKRDFSLKAWVRAPGVDFGGGAEA